MNAIELLKTPYYISSLNEVVPLKTITFNDIRAFVTNLVQMFDIALKTAKFMMTQGYNIIIDKWSNIDDTSRIIIILLIIIIIFMEHLNEKINKLEKQINNK